MFRSQSVFHTAHADTEFLREAIGFTAQRMMDVAVNALTGAPGFGQPEPDRNLPPRMRGAATAPDRAWFGARSGRVPLL